MILDGDIRHTLQNISDIVGGEQRFRSWLLGLRQAAAPAMKRERMEAFRAKLMTAMEIGFEKPEGARSPYDGMRKPFRGPAIPVPYQRQCTLAPCIWPPRKVEKPTEIQPLNISKLRGQK